MATSRRTTISKSRSSKGRATARKAAPAPKPEASADGGFSPRQQEVLSAALDELVETGDGLTMTAVAGRANCSKETLYKWFGDRDGLLTATVQWQASKVRAPQIDRSGLDARALKNGLSQFAEDLLTTLTGDVSVTLNRLAITHSSGIGGIMLKNGPTAVRKRILPLLEAAKAARLVKFADAEEAYRVFYGLVVRDTQIRLLLGERARRAPIRNASEAEAAVNQFLALYGTAAPRKAR
jgi:AcrR family transcriptional regulator